MRQITFLFTSLILFFAMATIEIYSEEPNVPKSENDADIAAVDESKNGNETKIKDAVKDTPTWTAPSQNIIRREIENWLKSTGFTDDSVRQNVLSLWKDVANGNNDRQIEINDTLAANNVETGQATKNIPGGKNAVNPNQELQLTSTELFDRTIESMRRASNHIAEYLKRCDTIAWQELPYGQKLVVPEIPLHIHLGESNTTQYLYNSLRIYLAMKLVQGRFFSEALTVLETIKPENCVNPAELFITKAILYNGLSRNEDGLEAIKNFRIVEKNEVAISRRHTELAKLLEYEMKESKNDNNPQNISKKMDNARRILGKGDPGKEAQETEEDILKSLEKLIKEIEERVKNADGSSPGKKDSLQSNNPAKDSDILRGKAPGNVDRKEFDQEGNWGNMPPKDREAALSKIEREFPSHYRDIIESYFREMANGKK
ncbi:MAG: hypothetical protein LBC74_04620 [Planctomycetaceae bacterium]|jgi:hypothetical protein|nr:hypothetical protein [Planctomycetaceae bacterium]